MKKRKNYFSPGLVFVALGLGVVLVCIFPSKWMVVLSAAALIAAGIMLIKQ